jgi:hypothetical protein
MQAASSRRHQVRYLEESGQLRQLDEYIEVHGTVVQRGPFAGMIYPLAATRNRWCVPKLMGVYERELHPLLALAQQRSYECVIDIGAAEGYYAVGLARLLGVPVFAFEPEPLEKAVTVFMAERNGVRDGITLEDLFDVRQMERFAGKRAFVVCDCEGFEEVLFRPETMHWTHNWDLLIELHGSAEDVLPRLRWPHAVQVLTSVPREGLESEHRAGEMKFLWCDAQGLAAV